MDRKQHKIIYFLFSLFIFSFVLSGCFLMKRRSKEFNRPLLKSINIDANNIVTIVLDNTNKYKHFGDIYEMRLFYLVPIFSYEENEAEIILKENISDYKEKFYEDCDYRIEIKWYGGHLFLETVFQNGQFTVLKEKYLDRI